MNYRKTQTGEQIEQRHPEWKMEKGNNKEIPKGDIPRDRKR